jgi:hypothetical protein
MGTPRIKAHRYVDSRPYQAASMRKDSFMPTAGPVSMVTRALCGWTRAAAMLMSSEREVCSLHDCNTSDLESVAVSSSQNMSKNFLG